MRMRKMKLTKYEQSIEDEIDQYVPMSKEKGEAIDRAIANTLAERRKNAVLNIRINKMDLDNLKSKAKRLGVKYQSFIAEILHKVATT